MLQYVYWLCGIELFALAGYSLFDRKNPRRYGNASFWALFAATFVFGGMLSDFVIGIMVVLMAVIGGFGLMGSGFYFERDRNQKTAAAKKFGNRIFLPALIVPLLTVLLNKIAGMDVLVAFGVSALAALLAALLLCRAGIQTTCNEGRRLLDAVGWAAILSQLLAALGFLFDKAGVGVTVARMVEMVVPVYSETACVVAYCLGMMLFAAIMGNAFAAFAVITAGIGIPMLIVAHGANPAVVGILGMLSGYCGTLCTPMAANFNVVPAALLELEDKNAVIKAQLPMAAAMIVINIILMRFMAL
jgi:uncharacterized membrane protein